MNDEDLIASIGTIAKSGTKSFVEALTGDAKKIQTLLVNSVLVLLCIYGGW